MSNTVKFGTEILANTTTAGAQIDSSVAALADGRFVVSWANFVGGVSGDIMAQVFNADGSKAGGEYLVASVSGSFLFQTTTAAFDNDRFVVSWLDTSKDGGQGSGFEIRAQIVNFDGSKSGAQILVSAPDDAEQSDPSLTTLANGRFVISWTDGSNSLLSLNETRAQIYNADGTTAGVMFLVNTTTLDHQSTPSIIGLDNGNFVVTWQDNSRTGGDTDGVSVRAQLFLANGTKSGAEFLVNTTTPGAQYVPSLTALGNNGFVVSWTDSGTNSGDTSGGAVRAQVFAPDGSKSGGEILVNSTTSGDQNEPAITALADDRFVVSWTDASASGGDSSGTAIRAQVFNGDGTRAGGELLVNTTTIANQNDVAITALADGRFVVSWTDQSKTGGDLSQSAVRAQIFDPRETAITLTGSNLDDDFIGTEFGDTLSGRKGDDRLSGQAGQDVLAGGKGNDILNGGRGADRLLGETGNDELSGAGGNDVLKGGGRNDLLSGGRGKDDLFGGGGNDILTGGKGKDKMTGGAGADMFVFNSVSDTGTTGATRDIIRDFKQAQNDLIDLSGIDAKSGPGGDQAFTFIATTAFSSTKGELRVRQNASETFIQGDTDGNGVKDFEIRLDGLITLTAGDFIL